MVRGTVYTWIYNYIRTCKNPLLFLFVLQKRTTSEQQHKGSLNTAHSVPEVLECRLEGNRIPIRVLIIQRVGQEGCFTVAAQVVYGQKEQSICLTCDKNQTPCCVRLNCFQFSLQTFIWTIVTSRSIWVNKDRIPCDIIPVSHQ